MITPGTLRSYTGKIKAVYTSTATLLKKSKQADISAYRCSETQNPETKREVKNESLFKPTKKPITSYCGYDRPILVCLV
jgi:hypothetical protein